MTKYRILQQGNIFHVQYKRFLLWSFVYDGDDCYWSCNSLEEAKQCVQKFKTEKSKWKVVWSEE